MSLLKRLLISETAGKVSTGNSMRQEECEDRCIICAIFMMLLGCFFLPFAILHVVTKIMVGM